MLAAEIPDFWIGVVVGALALFAAFVAIALAVQQKKQ